MVFDYRDDQNYKFAGLRVGSSRWVIGAMVEGVETILADSTAAPPQANTWYKLDVVVAHDRVTLYVAGQERVSWQPAGAHRLTGGQVGLMAKQGIAEFQELELWDVGHVTKTYAVGGQKIAFRRDNVLYYLYSDHLGSTTLLTNEQGQEAPGTRPRYYPYGAPRPADQAATHNAFALDYTAATFTGQRREVSTGLMYYGARFYDPALGRFLSPDTIVPQPGNPQSLNRYAYAANNPLRYTDPTGHVNREDEGGGGAIGVIPGASVSPRTWVGGGSSGGGTSGSIGSSGGGSSSFGPYYSPGWSMFQAYGLTFSWFAEWGPETYIFGPDDCLTLDVMHDPGMQQFRERWAESGYQLPFTWQHTADQRTGFLPYRVIGGGWVFVREHVVQPGLVLLGFGSKTPEGPIDVVGGTIGSLDRVSVQLTGNGMVRLEVHNIMGWESGSRVPGTSISFIPNRDRSTRGPGGTIEQYFYWWEPMPSPH